MKGLALNIEKKIKLPHSRVTELSHLGGVCPNGQLLDNVIDFKAMRTNRDKLSHLSNAYWHLDLISNTKTPELEVIKNLIEAMISKEKS